MAFDGKGLDDYIDVAQRIADFREQYPNGSLQPADPAKPWEQAVVNGYTKSGEPFAATMIVYTAAAYRTPDDQRPGIGVAWEPFPGRTPYTAGSELQNAETSAWGRAIIAALASDAKKGVASREEIRNRHAEQEPAEAPRAPRRTRAKIPGPEHERLAQGVIRGHVDGAKRGPIPPEENLWEGQPAGEFDAAAVTPENKPGSIDGKQRGQIMALFAKLGIREADDQRAELSDILRRDVSSRKGLSYVDAETVIKALKERKPAAEAAAS